MIEKNITVQELYTLLLTDGILNSTGMIKFKLWDTETIIKTRDTIGNSLQSWLGQWLKNNDIFYFEPDNTQEFPDFYLNLENLNESMIELKTFNNNSTPSFDIANFESYCESLKSKPYRLFADYLIIGYELDPETGIITIKNIWLKKIWEITGKSSRFALRTQVKRNIIYNIRPTIWYSKNNTGFKNKKFATEWITEMKKSYNNYYDKEIEVNIN